MSIEGAEVVKEHQEYVLQPWAKQGGPVLPIKRAEGIYFWDYDDKRYADMSSLLVCANLGHSNPDIIEAICQQAHTMPFMAPDFASGPKSHLAKKLVELAGADTYSRVFFTCGGAESNENAIKIARLVTGRTKVFSAYLSYHGATLGAAHASGDWRRFAAEAGGASGFVHFFNPYPYRDGYTYGVDEEEEAKKALAQLERQLHFEGTDRVAAILMESIVGANGVIIPPKGYMEGVRALCDTYGILLILDEVMAGFYRTGKPFTWQHFDLKPDIITFAKGVTSGYVPLGGVIVSKAIGEYFTDHVLPCGLTYSGHTLACAAGVAALNYYEQHHIAEHVQKVGAVLKQELQRLADVHPIVGEARAIGLFSSLELVKDKQTRTPLAAYGEANTILPAIKGELRKRGFSTFGRENNINICPPLIITEEELRTNLAILDDVLTWADQKYIQA